MSGATAATVAGYAAVAASVIGAGVSAVGAIQQGQAQQRQAQYQSQMAARNARIADQNAQMAEAEGREAKKAAYENSLRKRQEAARIIGAQRAAFGASGAQVDQGAALDLTLDTAEKGELDAFQLEQQGKYVDYNKRVEAWNFRAQAAGEQAKAGMYSNAASQYSPLLSGGGTLLSGLSQAGVNYRMMTRGSAPKN